MENPLPPDTKNQPGLDDGINVNRAFWAAVIFSIIGITSFGLGIYLAVTNPYWQLFLMLFTETISATLDVLSLILIRRGRASTALKIMYWSGVISLPINSLLIQNVAAFLIPMVLVIGFVEIYLLFPRSWRRYAPVGPIAAALTMLLVDHLNPPFRYTLNVLPSASSFGPIMFAFLVVGIIVLIVRQAWAGNIRVKIVSSFIMVALFSVAIVGAVVYISYRNQQLAHMRQRVLDIASLAALQQDGELHAAIRIQADMQSAAYQRMQAVNAAIIAKDQDLKYVYTMELNASGQISLIVTTQQGGGIPVNAWTTYEGASALLKKNFATLDHPIVETSMYTDEYGTVLSAYAPFYNKDGTRAGIIGADIDGAKILAQDRQLLNLILTIGGAALALAAILGLFLGTLFTRPVIHLAAVAQKVARGDLSARANVETQDEVGNLAITFNEMAAQLQETLATLEQRVAAATRNLTLAAEVGRTVTQVHEIDSLLEDAAELIRGRFGLYYTQVYLLDPTSRQLVLRAGTGEVGQQLLDSRHSLAVDLASLNGTAVVERHAIVVENTEASLVHRPNPLLPDTRSEMVIPLMVGERVVGTLDMQSSHAGALSKENLAAFEALAGQLAIAIENASLLTETEAARATVEAQSRRLVHSGWQEFLNAIEHGERIGYSYDLKELTSFDEPLLAEPDPHSLVADIRVSNEPVGLFKFKGEQTWNKDDAEMVTSVARQLSQQVENLRLLAQADQYRFRAEQALHRMTHEGWESQLAEHPDAKAGFFFDRNKVLPLSSAKGTNPLPVVTQVLEIAGEKIGELAVGGTHSLQEEAKEILSVVGEQLSARVENLRLLDQSQSALAQSEKLFNASRSLTEATDLQKLVDAAVSTLNIPQINRAVLATFNYDSNESIESLDIIANWWNGSGHEVTPVGTHYPLDAIHVMSMFVSPTPVFFNDSLHDERVDAVTLDLVKSQNLRAVAVLPLILGSRQIGALILEAEDPHNFTQNEIRLFSSLAPQIATILENRRQFERAQKQAERETMLNAINQKIQSATSVEAVLQIAARELGRALDAPLTIAQLGKNGKKKE